MAAKLLARMASVSPGDGFGFDIVNLPFLSPSSDDEPIAGFLAALTLGQPVRFRVFDFFGLSIPQPSRGVFSGVVDDFPKRFPARFIDFPNVEEFFKVLA